MIDCMLRNNPLTVGLRYGKYEVWAVGDGERYYFSDQKPLRRLPKNPFAETLQKFVEETSELVKGILDESENVKRNALLWQLKCQSTQFCRV